MFTQQQDVDISEAVWDETAFEESLKPALAEWRRAFDSSVASCALELQISNQRLLHEVCRSAAVTV